MRTHPRVLRVEAQSLFIWDLADGSLHYLPELPPRRSHWLRRVEAIFRLDFCSALQARIAQRLCDYDLIWAGSEKIGIPLSLMQFQKPLVVIAHHMSSPYKARFARATGVVDRWAGIGYISDEGRDFFTDYFGVRRDRLFQYECSKYLDKYNASQLACDGPLMSVGVAKRDYATLLAALADLPECAVELYISSKFGDALQRQPRIQLSERIMLMTWTPDQELVRRYHRTRFALVPLVATTHSGAGINAVLEASALGKAVIATKTGGMPTFVKDGVTGILVPPYDVGAWRDAIRMLWRQPELAHQMGQAGRRYMEERFCPEIVHARIDAFLEDLYARQRC